ncbi:MAG: hypothetical protein HKO89_07000 [Saprospiraceae bacterium]|nr:hypothetical protein [Saprospiraceae bacterium]
MKYLRSVVIIILLFGLPIGSWYFLKHGFNWRKSKIETLMPKDHILRDFDWSGKQKEELYSILFYKTTVINFDDEIDDKENLIVDQYLKANTFQWLNVTSDEKYNLQLSSKDKRKYFTSDKSAWSKGLLSGVKYALIDTGMYVRQVYPDNSEASLGMLVEDLSLIIPRKKEKDISIRKKDN